MSYHHSKGGGRDGSRGLGFSGFTLGSKGSKPRKPPSLLSNPHGGTCIPPPSNLTNNKPTKSSTPGLSKHGYSTLSNINANAINLNYGQPQTKRTKTEEE